LFYHGAHTGRWSGGEKINLQNLGSRGHDLVKAIRELLVAPPGYELVIADLSAVEARGVAYIADEAELVARFRDGEEIYCRLAEQVLGLETGTLRKPIASDPPPVADAYKRKRGLGKTGVLGCGYGMGAAKAEDYARSMGAGDIGPELAQAVVDTYRDSYRNITKFWKDIEKAFIYACKYDEPVRFAKGLQFHTETEPNSEARVVVLTLPSGRELKYHNVSLVVGDWGKDEIVIFNEKEHKRVRVWGGHLTENVVQAFCRDALAEPVLTLAEKYVVPLHVHDEAIVYVPEGRGKAVLEETIAHLSTSPDWAPGFPLGAEGKVTNRYGDH
jgi:DNA polymerase